MLWRVRGRPGTATVRRWLLGGAGAYGLVATVALLSIAVVGDRTSLTYTLALFAFIWLLPAPLLLLVPLWLRAPWVLAVLLGPAVLCGTQVVPLLVHRADETDAPADLRVATYNITNGAPIGDVAALVARWHPDLLLLQEVTAGSWDELGRLLPGYRYRSSGPLSGSPRPDGGAVLSRYPITSVEPVTGLPSGARPADVVTVSVTGRPVTVFSVHLASPCLGCGARNPNPAGTTGPAARVRVAEAQRYAALIAPLIARGRAVVFAGDLNSSPMNQPLDVLTASGLEDVHRAVGTSPDLTRGPGPGVARVDYVLVAGLRPLRERKGDRGVSTHSPVIADLAWPGGRPARPLPAGDTQGRGCRPLLRRRRCVPDESPGGGGAGAARRRRPRDAT